MEPIDRLTNNQLITCADPDRQADAISCHYPLTPYVLIKMSTFPQCSCPSGNLRAEAVQGAEDRRAALSASAPSFQPDFAASELQGTVTTSAGVWEYRLCLFIHNSGLT